MALPRSLSCHWQPRCWAVGSTSQPWETSNSLDHRSGPAGVHLSCMCRKWWRSEAHVVTSRATCALLMKSRLWFAGCLVCFRLLGYEHRGRVSACLKFVSTTVSHSVSFKTGTTVFLQTVFPSCKLWLPMQSHHRGNLQNCGPCPRKKYIYCRLFFLSTICLPPEIKRKWLQKANTLFYCMTESFA